MSFCSLLGSSLRSLCLDHVNSNGYAKFYQNIPKGSRDRASFTFFRIWTSAKPRPIPNTIWQSHWLHLVNINVYAKFYHNILHSSRDRAIFTFFRIWSSAKLRPIKTVNSQSLGLVNINVCAKVYQNIPLSPRDRAIFAFFQNLALGKASTDDKCHFAIPWTRSFQHQIVCKILSKYSKWFNS